MPFRRLVRFQDNDQVSYGDLISSDESGYTLKKLSGHSVESLQETKDVVKTTKVNFP